jgi:hypothetical protein
MKSGHVKQNKSFGIEVEDCARCDGKLEILAHMEKTARDQCQPELPLGARAPPPRSQANLL